MFRVNVQVLFEEQMPNEMQNMRVWLDHRHFQPITFRQSRGKTGLMFHLDFEDEAQAAAFATAFGGEIDTARAMSAET